jgi:hypothetical protein
MAEVPEARFDGPVLRLVLNNEAPLPLDRVAKLLDALAKDYSKWNPSDRLVVRGLHTGSLIAILGSLAKAADDGTKLIGFGKAVAGILASSRSNPKALNSRKTGVATAKEIVELAVAARIDVTMDYKGPDGEQVLLRVTARDAERIDGLRQIASSRFAPRGIDGPSSVPALRAPYPSQSFFRLPDASLLGALSLQELVALLRNDPRGASVLEDTAADLERQGRTSEAAQIRAALQHVAR